MSGETIESSAPVSGASEYIRLFQANLAAGKNWYIALLEAASQWTLAQEVIDGEVRNYLVGEEAFDLMLVAERLLEAGGESIPENEKRLFLFNNLPPVKLTQDELKNILGEEIFSRYLNYFYGITAEEALLVATEEEVRKEERGLNMKDEHKITDEAFFRIYGEIESSLLDKFRRAKEYPQIDSVNLGEIKEFTYWLFKYRLSHCDPEKSASDTKKALEWMKKQQSYSLSSAKSKPT
jgi:hypothetical protein